MTPTRERLRAYCRTESIGIVVPAAFVLLSAFWTFLITFSSGIVLPVVFRLTGVRQQSSLEYQFRGVTFQWAVIVIYGLALVFLALVVYVVFVYRSHQAGEDDARECPACKSAVPVDATRCAFCTSSFVPAHDDEHDTTD